MKEPLNLAVVRKSDLYGYWIALKSLGFKPGSMWRTPYKVSHAPHTFHRVFWTFRSDKRTVIIRISPHGYRLKVKIGRETRLDVRRQCWSHLEHPFMQFFKLKRPLKLARLGKQRKEVEAWLHEQKLAAAKRKAAASRKARKTKSSTT